MFWKPKSPISQDDEEWQMACWKWLLDHFGGPERRAGPVLVMPSSEFFPATEKTGHERAEHLFRCVAGHMNIDPNGFVLAAQDTAIDPVVGPLAVIADAPASPAGTFQADETGRLTITYDPALLEQPVHIIATFAHELSHPLLMSLPDEPPGGEECEEFATDLATTFFGFGLFGANSAFEFSQFSDVGGGSQGWSFRRTGYLTEAEWGFSLAVYLHLTRQPIEAAIEFLKPSPAGYLKKSMRYLDENEHVLSRLLSDAEPQRLGVP